MEWLTQNWVWVALGIGVAFYFFRGGLGGHAGGHGGLLGGMGHGAHGGGLGGHEGGHGSDGGGHERDAEQPNSRVAANAPEAAVDPVGGEAVRTAQALTSLYQDKIYYFASKENRDRFEAAPQEFAQKAAGHPVGSADAPRERPRRRGGC